MNWLNSGYSKRVYKGFRHLCFIVFSFSLISISSHAFALSTFLPNTNPNLSNMSLSTKKVFTREVANTFPNPTMFYEQEYNFVMPDNAIMVHTTDSGNDVYNVVDKDTGSLKIINNPNYAHSSSSYGTSSGPPTWTNDWVYDSTYFSIIVYPGGNFHYNDVIYNIDRVGTFYTPPPPPFTGDANFKLVNSGNYTGLKITNPYNSTTQKVPLVNLIAHARIPTTSALHDYIKPDVFLFGVQLTNNSIGRSTTLNFIKSNFQLFINNTFIDVVPVITLDSVESDFYNITIKVPFNMSTPDSTILIKSLFNTGVPMDSIPPTTYTDSVTLHYTVFTSVVTVTTSTDGKTVTTTTTKANGIDDVKTVTTNDDRSIKTIDLVDGVTTTIDVSPDGVITSHSDVVPIDTTQYTGIMDEIQHGFDSVTDIMVYALNGFVSIPHVLSTAMTSVLSSIGELIPLMKTLFSFFPPEVNNIIVTCFGFLGVGVALRTFGRK